MDIVTTILLIAVVTTLTVRILELAVKSPASFLEMTKGARSFAMHGLSGIEQAGLTPVEPLRPARVERAENDAGAHPALAA